MVCVTTGIMQRLDADELEEHYRKRTTLGVNIVPVDIAEAVLHFAAKSLVGVSQQQPEDDALEDQRCRRHGFG